ncbi:MAG TPA: hypothetical protein VK530_17505 [Candidatus Acidoferrum sp.]|nr:hypothetical protein [Candidatus Acidoferrum sp.]
MAEQSKSKTTVTVIVVLATLLLMAFLVRQMINYTKSAPVGADRSATRAKDNATIRETDAQALTHYGWADQPRGIARLPIDEAMKLTVQGYKNAGEFRKDFLARVDKANVPPPKPPEKPSEYE